MKESRDVRKVTSRLEREGWQNRKGKGDHVNFFKRGNPFLITIDMEGKRSTEISTNALGRLRDGTVPESRLRTAREKVPYETCLRCDYSQIGGRVLGRGSRSARLLWPRRDVFGSGYKCGQWNRDFHLAALVEYVGRFPRRHASGRIVEMWSMCALTIPPFVLASRS